MNRIILVSLLLIPLAGGAALSFCRGAKKKTADVIFAMVLIAEAILAGWYLFLPDASLDLFAMTDTLRVSLASDGVSRVFLAIGAFGFLFAGIYATRYMEHGSRQSSFYAFMLFSLTALIGMD